MTKNQVTQARLDFRRWLKTGLVKKNGNQYIRDFKTSDTRTQDIFKTKAEALGGQVEDVATTLGGSTIVSVWLPENALDYKKSGPAKKQGKATGRVPVNFRMSIESRDLAEKLADHWGLKYYTRAVEKAVVEMAKAEGLI